MQAVKLNSMWHDILKLRDFYHGNVGRTVRRALRPLVEAWLPTEGYVLGIGYTQPYMKPQIDNPHASILMPARMGVVHWPQGHENRTLMAWENRLPYADGTFDTIFIAHALEYSGNPQALLQEVWRVLKPHGRAVVMVPNRRSPWCRIELPLSPFVRGHPYSSRELHKLLRLSHFKINQAVYGLYVPPTTRGWLLRAHRTFDKMGQRWWPLLGGIILVEAQKDMYGMRVQRTTVKAEQIGVAIPAVSYTRL